MSDQITEASGGNGQSFGRLLPNELAALLAVALILRVLWAFIVPVMPLSDGLAYDTLARTLAEHSVYGWDETRPSALYPVGTAAIYAFVYKLFGFEYGPIVALGIIANLIFILCVFALAEHFFNSATAMACCILLAIWPTHIFYSTVLASELYYMVATALAAIVWFILSQKRPALFVLAGVCFAAASYIRPTALLLPVVFAAGAGLWTGHWRRQLIGLLAVGIVMALLIAPWTYRNYNLFSAFVPISTNGGVTLWMGNNESGTLGYAPYPKHVKGLNEYETSKTLSKEAKEFIIREPYLFVWRALKKVVYLHSHESIGVWWNKKGIEVALGPGWVVPLKILTQLFWMAVLGVAILGVGLMLRQEGWRTVCLHPLILTWAYYITVHSVSVAQDRYHFSFAFVIAILAAHALGYARFLHK